MGYKQAAGSGVTVFSDDFVRTDGITTRIGDNYDVRRRGMDHMVSYSESITLPSGRLVTTNNGGPVIYLPRGLDHAATWGKAQYSQARFRSAFAYSEFGPGVFLRWESDTVRQYGYRFGVDRWGDGSLHTFVHRLQNGTPDLNLVSDPVVPAGLDVFRLEVTPVITVPGVAWINTLRLYQNGTLVSTMTDSAILPSGMPGLVNMDGNGANTTWDSFECGVL